MSSYSVGEVVQGKVKGLNSQLGTIKEIVGDGKKRKYSILFADNKIKVVSCRSITKIATFTGLNNLQPDLVDQDTFEPDPNLAEEEILSMASDSTCTYDELNNAFIR